MGKIKQEAEGDTTMDTSTAQLATVKDEPLSYDDKVKHCSAIAKPMASRKQTKKILKLIKKATGQKKFMFHGLKLVQKQLRRGNKGLVIFAGNVSPIEIMCHLPGVCEELGVPYIYTPCGKDIGAAMGTKRGCVSILIKEHDDYKELYEECLDDIKTIPSPV